VTGVWRSLPSRWASCSCIAGSNDKFKDCEGCSHGNRHCRPARFGVIAFSVLIGAGWISVHVFLWLWTDFRALDSTLSVGILTAATTIFVSTLTVVLGRYYERKKDIEAAYRQKKTEIYDEFLKEFFKLFHDPQSSEQTDSDQLTQFLREWHRKIVLWGGQDVVRTSIDWLRNLKAGYVDAGSMLRTADFLRAMRADLGQSNWKLSKGAFIHFILRDADLFLIAAQKNPKITLAELAALEREIQKITEQANKATTPDHHPLAD
jgi:hypothetical protein